MRQFHARQHFYRVEVLASIQNRLTGGKLWARETAHIYTTPRYLRICRCVATYRTVGYLNRQEL